MELETLLKEREAYGGKILKLGIQIAVIFIVPVGLAVLANHLWNISFIYLFPLAFIISWTCVIVLYRRISREVRELDTKIKALKMESPTEGNSQAES